MTTATIYSPEGDIIAAGLRSALQCDHAKQTARSIARDRGHSVIVEDAGTQQVYRVTPAGHIWRAPKSWFNAAALEQDHA